MTATPDAGWHFTEWSDGVLTPSRIDTGVMADLTVTASFATDSGNQFPTSIELSNSSVPENAGADAVVGT